MKTPPLWATIYPTVADVQLAAEPTLAQWLSHLPEPQNDVQVTVVKRIRRRYLSMQPESVQKSYSDIMDQMVKLNAEVEKLTGKPTKGFVGK